MLSFINKSLFQIVLQSYKKYFDCANKHKKSTFFHKKKCDFWEIMSHLQK